MYTEAEKSDWRGISTSTHGLELQLNKLKTLGLLGGLKTMHSIQTVAEQNIQVANVTGTGWPDVVDDGHSSLDSTEFQEILEDPGFLADLKWACKWTFNRFSQSTHSSWEDLQQEVLIRFWYWLPRYRKEAKRKTVFARIATNVLIDAMRAEGSLRRQHAQIDLDDLKHEPVQGGSKRAIENRIFLQECREVLSQCEVKLFDEHFILGRSLRQLADSNGVSAAALSKRRARIIKKLQARLTLDHVLN